jgi:hypothetical protein
MKESSLPPDEVETIEAPITKQQYFKKHLHYNPETGEFHRLFSSKWNIPCFTPITLLNNIEKRGEVTLSVKGKNYSAKNVAYCYMTGHYPNRSEYLLHHDKNPMNFIFSNFDLKSRSHVLHHSKPFTKSMGIYKTKYGKFQAKIHNGHGVLYLGTFDTEQEARIAYMKKKLEFRNMKLL